MSSTNKITVMCRHPHPSLDLCMEFISFESAACLFRDSLFRCCNEDVREDVLTDVTVEEDHYEAGLQVT